MLVWTMVCPHDGASLGIDGILQGMPKCASPTSQDHVEDAAKLVGSPGR